MSELNDYCYGCGKKNPGGLKLEFSFQGEELFTEVVIDKKFEGYPGIAHGGLVCSILDELMAAHMYRLGRATMTADLQVRFKLPVPLGRPVCFYSRVESARKRLWVLEARCVLPSGEVAATARAKLLPARFELEGKTYDYQEAMQKERG